MLFYMACVLLVGRVSIYTLSINKLFYGRHSVVCKRSTLLLGPWKKCATRIFKPDLSHVRHSNPGDWVREIKSSNCAAMGCIRLRIAAIVGIIPDCITSKSAVGVEITEVRGIDGTRIVGEMAFIAVSMPACAENGGTSTVGTDAGSTAVTAANDTCCVCDAMNTGAMESSWAAEATRVVVELIDCAIPALRPRVL